jgi:hypothetical protein
MAFAAASYVPSSDTIAFSGIASSVIISSAIFFSTISSDFLFFLFCFCGTFPERPV